MTQTIDNNLSCVLDNEDTINGNIGNKTREYLGIDENVPVSVGTSKAIKIKTK